MSKRTTMHVPFYLHLAWANYGLDVFNITMHIEVVIHSMNAYVWCWSKICGSLDEFIYLGFYVAFNTVQVISRRVVGRAEETSTYSSLGFCTVNCRPTASNYQLSHLRPCRESNPGLRGGRRECYHSATVAPSLDKIPSVTMGSCESKILNEF